VAPTPIEIRDVEGDAGDVCRTILDLLPSWFGIPEANDAYVQTAATHPSVIATINGDDVGITTIKHHSPYAAEVYLMAVKPRFHRAGIGTAMLRHLEDMLAAQGIEFLQVKTLSASRPDDDYDKTRAFYLAYGFRPLEEFPTLWDPSNPALQLIKAVATR
jgi:GNAT superfamily N-acetyltransferase